MVVTSLMAVTSAWNTEQKSGSLKDEWLIILCGELFVVVRKPVLDCTVLTTQLQFSSYLSRPLRLTYVTGYPASGILNSTRHISTVNSPLQLF